MSCSNIGLGMNNVVRTVVSLMDQERLSKDAAKTIIKCCAMSVNWCDGNSYEAIDYINGCMCGRCMKVVPKGEKLYSVYSVSQDVPNSYHLVDELATDGLCEECFDIVLNAHCNDPEAGKRQRAYIEEHERPEKYTSTGRYENSNNGFKWVD